MEKYNPFMPGKIVSPYMFKGRMDELRAFERILVQARNGNAEHFLIDGERGIGKSSLLLYMKCVAQGSIPSLGGTTYSFVTVSIQLDDKATYASIARRIAVGLQQVMRQNEKIRAAAGATWDFLKNWEVLGVQYKDKPTTNEDDNQFLEDLASALCATSTRVQDGILVLVDEADKPPASAGLGAFMKLLTERLTIQGGSNVAIGICGQSGVVKAMRESHPSSARIFQTMTLQALEKQEVHDVLTTGMRIASEKSNRPFQITDGAAESIVMLSEGYPHFLQQFAYSSFAADTDDTIDPADVLAGCYMEHGAFHQLGLSYFEGMYFEDIRSDEYRKVLGYMAGRETDWVRKAEIRDNVDLIESRLNNAIHALKTRKIIVPQQGKRGVYRLRSRSFAIWIMGQEEMRPGAEAQD